MNGYVSVESVYGKGSIFTFTVPVERGTKADLKVTSSTTARRFIAPDARVLIVDDVQVNIEIAEFMLEAFEVSCECAYNGLEAVEKLKEHPDFDLILMDHMMPVMDGIEATQLIRKLPGDIARIPIIALTANALTGNDVMFKEAGMDGFVSKPISMEELAEALYQHLPPSKIAILEDPAIPNECPSERP
jgi:CheY-like chemotaxis protein